MSYKVNPPQSEEDIAKGIATDVTTAIKCAERLCGPVDFGRSEFLQRDDFSSARYLFKNGWHLIVEVTRIEEGNRLLITPCGCWSKDAGEDFLSLFNNANEVH